MTSYIQYVSPEGFSCSQYYREYCESTGGEVPLPRDEFDKLVSGYGYYKSRPSALVSKDRKWRWKKIDP